MSNPTLRNMTAIYLLQNDKILLLYREGSKVSNNKWIGAAGGHFEGDARRNFSYGRYG